MKGGLVLIKPRRPFERELADWRARRDAVRAQRVRLGVEGYAFVVAVLKRQPSTRAQLQERTGLGHTAAVRVLRTLHALREVHVSGWLAAVPGQPVQPVYTLGKGTDAAPPPMHRDKGTRRVPADRRRTARLCPAVLHFMSIKRTLDAPSTRADVCEATGVDKTTITRALEVLVALNLARVVDWLPREQGGAPLPVYEWGPGRNEPPPAALDAAQKRERANQVERDRRRRLKAAELAMRAGAVPMQAIAAQPGATA